MMGRFGGVFWFILVIASGMTNFIVKQYVQGLDDQLAAVRKKTVAEQKAIHELTADWTFLNQPELLADLNNRYVHLGPMAPRQVIGSIDALPLRPPPPPATAETAPLIAAAAPAPPSLVPASPGAAPPPMPAPSATVASVAPPPSAPPPASTRPPILPLSVITTAHAAPAPPVSAPPARPAKSVTLDGLFAQVSGDR